MRLAIYILVLLLPQVSMAAVTLSEVAWMGDEASHNYEWIELYNDGASAVVLDDWTLTDESTLSIALSGTVPPHGYVVLERNRSSAEYLFSPPFLTYAGALVNTGTTLTLRNAGGVVMDVVADDEAMEGWDIGGDNLTKETAQYTAAGWGTGAPTPGQPNAWHQPLPDDEEGDSPVVTSVPTTTDQRRRTSGGGVTTATETVPIRRGPFTTTVMAQSTAYVNQPVYFTATSSGLSDTLLHSLSYQWNFGDLATGTGRMPVHAYRFPGTYVVYVTALYRERRATARFDITVLPVVVTLARSAAGDIMIHNNAPYDIDMSHYALRIDGRTLTVPPQTVVPQRGTLTVAGQRVGATATSQLVLLDNLGVAVAVWPTSPSAQVVVPATPLTIEPPTPLLRSDTTTTTAAVAAVPLTTTASSTPLVLVPPVSPSPFMPSYVAAALQAPPEVGLPWQHYWPYAALVGLMVVAVGVLIASGRKVGSTPLDFVGETSLYTGEGGVVPPWLRPPR